MFVVIVWGSTKLFTSMCVWKKLWVLLMKMSSAATKESNIMMKCPSCSLHIKSFFLFTNSWCGWYFSLSKWSILFWSRIDRYEADIRISLPNTSSSHDTCVIADIRICMTGRIFPAMKQAEPRHTVWTLVNSTDQVDLIMSFEQLYTLLPNYTAPVDSNDPLYSADLTDQLIVRLTAGL